MDHIHGGDSRIEKMLGTPHMDFEGNMSRIEAKFRAGIFKGSFTSRDMKRGVAKFSTTESVYPARYFTLPKQLEKTRMDIFLYMPVDLLHPTSAEANLSIKSNLLNTSGAVRYDGNFSARLVHDIPKGSLLYTIDHRLHPETLFPLKTEIWQNKKKHTIKFGNRITKGILSYNAGNRHISGKMELAGAGMAFSGNAEKSMDISLKISSIKKLADRLGNIYRADFPKLDGDLSMEMSLEEFSRLRIKLHSNRFVPDSTSRIKNPIKNISIKAEADMKKKTISINNYAMETGGIKIFSRKPSFLHLEKEKILLEPFWINDSLKLKGFYDYKKKKGSFKGKAKRFRIDHKNAKIDTSVDLTAKISGEAVNLNGRIIILGGTLEYDMEARHYATDEDIIIVQHRKKEMDSFFRKNFGITLYVETEKPLLFRQKNVYAELRPQLGIIKVPGSDLQILGSIPMAKNGYYIFENRKFILDTSSINFTGSPTRPLLDINFEYNRYGHKIFIRVSGMATEPILNFSSTPYMTRNQILSFILFDTENAGENNTGDMISLVGGGLAKSILENMGLKVDTLVLTEEGFEIGKKITDKITVIYDQEEESRVIVRIRHSKHTQSDVSIGSESQSADIIYKKEF